MSSDFEIGQNDTLPVFDYQLIAPNGAAANLTNATVDFELGLPGETPIINSAATIVNAAEGQVSFAFTQADSAQAGLFHGRFVVTYPYGGIETYPDDEPLRIQITETP